MIDFRFEAFPESSNRTYPVLFARLDIIETVFDLRGVLDFHDAGKAQDQLIICDSAELLGMESSFLELDIRAIPQLPEDGGIG